MELVKITRESGIPLVGHIAFGIIDRGSNLLQVRATTVCNLACTFCSTAAGPEIHPCNYEVEVDYLLDWVKEVIRLKECEDIEINIDSAGEPTAYPELIKLVTELKKIKEIRFISMQTNGSLLDEKKIKELEKAGLNRINLSIHAVDEELAKQLMGSKYYDLKKVEEVARVIVKTSIELNLTPVLLPGVNEKEMVKLIQFAKEIKCKIAIQKYELYKYSRKEKKVKVQNWYKFYKQLEIWEKEFDIKLKYGPRDFKVYRTKKIPLIFQKGDVTIVEVKAEGWINGEVLAAAKNRAVTLVDSKARIGDRVKVKMLDVSNSIYLAKKV